MAEAALVTDTHPLLFYAHGGRGLSRRAAAHFAACERQTSLVYVPAAVVWECSILRRVGKIAFRPSLRGFFTDLFANPAFQPVELSPEQVFLADEGSLQGDPFDALICATARSLELPLLTRDERIARSGSVAVVW